MMTAQPTQPPGELGPEQLLQMSFSFTASRVLSSALQLDLFSRIAEGNRTASEIAKAAGAQERSMRMLLDALVGLQLLCKSKDGYELTPVAENFLVRSSLT